VFENTRMLFVGAENDTKIGGLRSAPKTRLPASMVVFVGVLPGRSPESAPSIRERPVLGESEVRQDRVAEVDDCLCLSRCSKAKRRQGDSD
jgi:hypothetical protein